jgi:autotransporter-associated beta strand protein
MLPTWLRKLTNPKSLAAGRRGGAPANRKPSCRLQLETLEDRVTPSHTYTWSGGGDGSHWSNANNWKEGISPALDSAADLVFPPAPIGSHFTPNNDLLNLTVHSITFTNNDNSYSLFGDAITLWGGVTDNSPAVSISNQPLVNQISLSVTLSNAIYFYGWFYLNTTWTVASGSSLLMAGTLSGPSGLYLSGGTLKLGSPNNSYSGETDIHAGTVSLVSYGRLSNSSAVVVETGATLDLSGQTNQYIASLAGAGNVKLGSCNLWLGYNWGGTGPKLDTTFSGIISGTGGLKQWGTGTFTLSGPNTYTGLTYVAAGTVLVTGTLPGNVYVLGTDSLDTATLGGNGTVGIITVGSWGSVDPGVSGSGTLHCSSAVFYAGSSFTAHAGAQLSATGKIDLSGSPTLIGPYEFSTVGASNTIIQGASRIGGFIIPNVFYLNGGTYFSLGGDLFLVQYTSTGVVLTRVA